MVAVMSNERRDGEGDALKRLETVVKQRSANAVWRAFVVAQATARVSTRRRDMTTQRLFLTGLTGKPER